VPPRLFERLLGDVFRGDWIARDGQRDAVHHPLKTAHERDRQVGVTRAETSEQRLVRQPVGGTPHRLHSKRYGLAAHRDCSSVGLFAANQ
jgi:hypothetical protein